MSIHNRMAALRAKRDLLQDQCASLNKRIEFLLGEEITCEACVSVFREILDQDIMQAVTLIASMINEGLRDIFDDQEIRVEPQVDVVRGKVSVRFLTIVKDGEVEVSGDSADAFGGAVTTVQSLLLRVILIYLRKLRPVLFLDETLPAFDARYVLRAGDFLRRLCERMGLDVLLVTHNPTLVEAAHLAYRVEKRDGAARFLRLNPGEAP